MQDDGPTFPRYDAPGRTPGGMPAWPEMNTGADARRQRYSAGGARPTTLAAILAVSIGANVALIAALLAVVLLARAGYFAPSQQGGTGSGISATTTITTTPAPSPSATPAAGGLKVTPTSVQLGCDSGQQSQYVVLANSGSDSVDWQLEVSGGLDQAGVSISPRHGTLRPGTSIVIRLQNISNGNGQQGVITFTSDTQAAGSTPTLSYTTAGC
ncbi:MAG TPA: hypothetical protein VJO13_20130 [Ktedonobacterales bacterium]|nr:hypothetical protein [Ktedonobacterales bacterium]